MPTLYALANPWNGHFFYIGLTKNPLRRYKEHVRQDCNTMWGNPQYLYGYFNKLVRSGRIPKMVILRENAETGHEINAIKYYGKIRTLYNVVEVDKRIRKERKKQLAKLHAAK